TDFKDSELGRIPKSWEVVTLRERFTFGGGSTPSREKTEYFCDKGRGYIWVKTTDLNDSDMFSSEENITKEGLSASSCKIHPAGTVVVAMYGGWNQIGRSGLLRNDASINQALTAILPSESIIPPFLNYWLVTMRYLWKQIAASSRKDPNITKADVEGFKIAIPSIEEQQNITKIADAISHKILMVEMKLSQTQSLKKSLMQDLLTGKVRVTAN
ncbi:restriction endonuclease subunit S, partial [Gammaproteobacteria bacterium]|nr:restriction endonuclease subunit S [Gammaproteobacteria bacterium]